MILHQYSYVYRWPIGNFFVYRQNRTPNGKHCGLRLETSLLSWTPQCSRLEERLNDRTRHTIGAHPAIKMWDVCASLPSLHPSLSHTVIRVWEGCDWLDLLYTGLDYYILATAAANTDDLRYTLLLPDTSVCTLQHLTGEIRDNKWIFVFSSEVFLYWTVELLE